MKDRGILTIATGAERFINMAINLAKSIDLNSPGWSKAVITDSDSPELAQHYDYIIPIDNELPAGFTQKLKMYDYSPFEKTLWIDSDSLVIDNLEPLFNQLDASTDVSCIGFTLTRGQWAGVEIQDVIKKIDIPYLIIHNGGVYFFRKSETATKVFNKAKDLLKVYDEVGFYKLRGKTAHEPLMSSGMSYYHMQPIDDENKGMRTFVDISSELTIDVINKKCEFYEFKGAKRRLVKPVIAHFSGSHADWFHYKREVKKLNLHLTYQFIPKQFLSKAINFLYNPPYIIFIIFYRGVKAALGKEKFKLKPFMPALRYK